MKDLIKMIKFYESLSIFEVLEEAMDVPEAMACEDTVELFEALKEMHVAVQIAYDKVKKLTLVQ